jgi:lipopolysaccharide transport system ATP-binding protein/teichoic acid transport system ATP-binding protein
VEEVSNLRNAAISVHELTVRFTTTRERKIRRLLRSSKTTVTVEALTAVSFEVAAGSIFGLIGSNGSGKTTLMRALAGVFPPTEGSIEIRGRVTPMLSRSVGFNPGLTGRENVLLAGLANGMAPPELEALTPDIIDFAEIGDAIDYPVRTYSSGMRSRLGFAVTSHLHPDILLIDEGLSAGDAAFRTKCSQKFDELLSSNCTIVLVAHGFRMIEQFADFCLWLDHGEVAAVGPTEEVLQKYVDAEAKGDWRAVEDEM